MTRLLRLTKRLTGFFKHKVYGLRAGVFPLGKNIKLDKLNDAPIIDFLKNEACEFSNIDGIKIMDQYIDNKKAIIFLDPPYLISYNGLYDNPEGNIYEHISSLDLKKKKSLMMFILEQNWMLKLLFKKYKIIEYKKMYEMSKKKTTHFILLNR